MNTFDINRRETLKMLGFGGAGALSLLGSPAGAKAREHSETPAYAKGLAPVKIKSVKATAIAPQGSNLIVVKVETTEPGLYALGCATFTQRAVAVVTAINSYLHDFCVGKDVDNIEDMWQSAYVSSYWRNGPVLNGGSGSVRATVDKSDFKVAGFGYEGDQYMNVSGYLKSVPKMFEVVRKQCGDDIELLHDVHERVQPMEAINMINQVEEYQPFFIEDPFSPENIKWFAQLRQATTVPIAMGELFNNINEFKEPMVNQWFDFIRIHVSQIGGITSAMKVARLSEWFNVRTAWPSGTLAFRKPSVFPTKQKKYSAVAPRWIKATCR